MIEFPLIVAYFFMKIFPINLPFPILKAKNKISKYNYFWKKFPFQKIPLIISATDNFTFKFLIIKLAEIHAIFNYFTKLRVILIFLFLWVNKKNIYQNMSRNNISFEIWNNRVVENIFLKKISHRLWKSNHF